MLLAGIRRESLRFTFSPLQEVMRALHVFSDPRHHAEQMGWVRGARRRVTRGMKAEIRRFRLLLHPVPELFPDLLPSQKAPAFALELSLLAQNTARFSAAVIRRMTGKPLVDKAEIAALGRPAALKRLAREAARRTSEDAPLLEAYVASPERVLDELCTLLNEFFDRCLAAQWPQIEKRALDDVRSRERLLERFGVAPMLRTLTRHLAVSGDRRRAFIEYGGKERAGVRLDLPREATLALTPSYFIWPHTTLVVLRRTTIDVRIAYPLASPSTIRPRNRLWEQAAGRFGALADPTRLQMLDLLGERSLSTREFAGLLGLSEGGVSRHLSILRDAGLVRSVRDGYFVLYERAPDGLDGLMGIMNAL